MTPREKLMQGYPISILGYSVILGFLASTLF